MTRFIERLENIHIIYLSNIYYLYFLRLLITLSGDERSRSNRDGQRLSNGSSSSDLQESLSSQEDSENIDSSIQLLDNQIPLQNNLIDDYQLINERQSQIIRNDYIKSMYYKYCMAIFKSSFIFDIPYLLLYEEIKEFELLLVFLTFRITISLCSCQMYSHMNDFLIYKNFLLIYFKLLIDICLSCCLIYYYISQTSIFIRYNFFIPLFIIVVYNIFVELLFIFITNSNKTIYQCSHITFRDNDTEKPYVNNKQNITDSLQYSPHSVINEENCIECRCSICFESCHQKEIYNLTCHHLFHEECMLKWIEIKYECPLCRTSLTI